MSHGEQESLVAVICSSAVNNTKAAETMTAKILKWGLYIEKIKITSGISLNLPKFKYAFWCFPRFAMFSD